jgi:hypothetical protein
LRQRPFDEGVLRQRSENLDLLVDDLFGKPVI